MVLQNTRARIRTTTRIYSSKGGDAPVVGRRYPGEVFSQSPVRSFCCGLGKPFPPGPHPCQARRGIKAKTFVSFIRLEILEYSLGSWGTSSMVLHTAVGIPCILNRFPTV